MKNSIWKSVFVLALGMFLSFGFGLNAQAQLAKQGNFSGTSGYAGKALKVHLVGKTPRFIMADFFGVSKNDAGSGIFHNNSFNCSAAINLPKFPSTVSKVYCTFFDSDLHTITFEATSKGTLGGEAEAVYVIIDGTGKYKGITGKGTYEIAGTPTAAQGTFQGFGVFRGSYRLP